MNKASHLFRHTHKQTRSLLDAMLLSSTVWWSALALSGSSFANKAWRDGLSAKRPQVHMSWFCRQLCWRFTHLPSVSSGNTLFLMKSFRMNNLSVMSALIHPAHRVKKTHNSLLTSLGKWPVLQSKEIKKRIHWIMRSYHLRICTHKPANWEASADRLGQLLSPVEQQRNKTKMWKLGDFGYGFHVMMALHGGFLLG